MLPNLKVGAQREGHWGKPMVYDTTFLVDGEGGIRGGFRVRAGAVDRQQPLRDFVEGRPYGSMDAITAIPLHV